ncbi:hypothetical protein T484DRAFT_1860950 [Baffinella frigidus]|nr:hypothetical protein T484DRAFT_1860950 [Cryptophyta sp. CCMP2293]
MRTRPAVLAAFRRLMRARELAFKGDAEMTTQSRLAVREEFAKGRAVTDPAQITEMIGGADEAAHMLLHQLVQGKRKGEGQYEMDVQARHTTMDPNKMPGDP